MPESSVHPVALIRRSLGGATVGFTNRHGGTSDPPFDSLNLARHVDDDARAVAANQRLVAAAMGVPAGPWVMPHHVHGTTVLTITDATGHDAMGQDATGHDALTADGVATDRRGVLLVALGADCAPIAIANDTACAAVHAGWRGAVDGVVEAGVAAVRELGRGPVHAVVGPCACASHYEFGAELLAELVERVGSEVAARTFEGAPAFDLRAAIAHGFARAEVDTVEFLDVCTIESPEHFSYRRDGRTGRHGVVVVLA
jgi:YfiH family protein